MLRLLACLLLLAAPPAFADDALTQARDALAERRHEKAIELYSRILDAHPNHVEARLSRSLAYEDLEDADKALLDLEAILVKSPEHVGALVSKARVLRRGKYDFPGALKACEAVLKLDPNHPEATYQRAAALLEKPDDASLKLGHQELDRYAAMDPLDARHQIVRGHLHSAARDPKAARRCYEEARRLRPDDLEGDFHIAWAAAADGDEDTARRLFEGLRKCDKVRQRMSGRFGLVHLLMRQQRIEEALALTDEAIRDSEKHAASLYLLRAKIHYDRNEHEAVVEDCTACLKHSGSVVGEACFYRGVSHAIRERFPEAIVDLTAAIKADPDQFQPYRNRCVVYMHLGKIPEAVEDANQCARLEPKEPRYVILRGMLRKSLGLFQQAEKDFDAALVVDPAFKGVHFERGSVRMRIGKAREAAADFDEAIRQRPEDGEAFLLRGACWLMLGDKKRALADYQEAKKLNRDPTAQLVIAMLTNQGIDEALETLDEAVRNEPERPMWRTQRAAMLIQLKRWEKAIEDCDMAIKADPNDVPALSNRALCWLSLKEADKALADCNAVIAKDPADANIWSVRTMVYYRKGDFAKALADANEYVRLAPKNPQAYANRALVLTELGETAKSLDDSLKASRLEATALSNEKQGTLGFAIGMRSLQTPPPLPPPPMPVQQVNLPVPESIRRPVEESIAPPPLPKLAPVPVAPPPPPLPMR